MPLKSVFRKDVAPTESLQTKIFAELPNNVAAIGTASSPTDDGPGALLFETDTKGRFRSRNIGEIYHPVLVKWNNQTLGIMKGQHLQIKNLEQGKWEEIETTIETIGMQGGLTSSNRKYLALFSYAGESGLTITDGKTIKSTYHPMGIESAMMTDEGTLYSLVRPIGSSEEKNRVCIYSFSFVQDLSHQCISIDISREYALAAIGTLEGETKIIILWTSGEQTGFSTFRYDRGNWHLEFEATSFDYSPSRHGLIEDWFIKSGTLYLLTDYPGIMTVKPQRARGAEPDVNFHDLSDFILGPSVSHTIDGNTINYVFSMNNAIISGQYLTSFNIDSPEIHVGPWRIPEEILESQDGTLRVVESIFITDERTRSTLQAEKQ